MDNGFASLIDAAASILVLLPVKPTFDSVSAGLSLYLSLMDRKPVSISCPSPMMVGFNRIVGVDKISSDLGNKNLTIKFKGYDASSIEKVSYDIIDGEFNLTVVPKVGFTAPAENQIDVGFSGISSDLIILIGGKDDADFPMLSSKELAVSKIAHIGVHSFNSQREVLSFAKPGSSVSELVASLIKDMAGVIDPDISTNLVMGIEEGANNFASPEVTPDTFETFAYLLRNGGRRQSRIKLSPTNFPAGSIPTQPYTQKVSQVLQVPPAFAQASAGKQVLQEDVNLEQIENKEEMDIENAPDDWLQPKVFKGAVQSSQPTTFSENKG